jgi:hypothetical protein
MISIEVNKESDSDWNRNLLCSKYATVYQTVEYASYVQSRMKSVPLYMRFYNECDKLVGQLLVFQSFKGRGKISKLFGRGFVYSAVAKASTLLPQSLNWNFGPIIFDDTCVNNILESLGDLLTSKHYRFRGSAHPLNENIEFSKKFDFHKQEEGTFIIDLKQDLQVILDNTDKKSVRKNIDRAEERGVIVTQIESLDDISTYYQILSQHRIANELVPYSFEDVAEGFKLMKSVGHTGFLAWSDKTPIGGITISSFGGYINELGIARSNLDAEKKLYSLDLLRWKIIEWGKQNNCLFYDLSGVKLKNRSSKDDGIFRNKEKWGGKLVQYSLFSKS